MTRKQAIGWGLAGIMGCLAATLVWAEAPDMEKEPMRGQGRMKHGAHQPLHAEMRARMQAHDARLDELVAAMNDAKGETKIDAIAAVVNELVAQRRTRRNHMEERWNHEQRPAGKQKQQGGAP